MQIGLDYRPALTNREGIGRYVRELTRAMVEREPELELELFGSTLAAARFELAELGLARVGARGPRLHRLRVPSRIWPPLLALTGRGLDDFLGRPALYHHTSYNRLSVRSAVEVATIHDCAWLDERRFVDPKAATRMERAARELVRHAHTILVPSQHSKEEVVRLLNAHPERVRVTHLGGDHRLGASEPRRDDRSTRASTGDRTAPYLLSVSRIDRRKNFPRMLAAFERLVAEGFPQRWIVVGPAGYAGDEFSEALERSPARERIERRMDVRDEELAQLYANADLFLFVSLTEGFGIPALEAMGAGTPVLAGDSGATPELCGDAAVLVAPEETDAIFEAARELLADDDRRRELGRRGRERAARFTWRRTAEQTLAAYRSALEPDALA